MTRPLSVDDEKFLTCRGIIWINKSIESTKPRNHAFGR